MGTLTEYNDKAAELAKSAMAAGDLQEVYGGWDRSMTGLNVFDRVKSYESYDVEDCVILVPVTGYGYGTDSLYHSNTDVLKDDFPDAVTAHTDYEGVRLALYDYRDPANVTPWMNDDGEPDVNMLERMGESYEYLRDVMPVLDEDDYYTRQREACERYFKAWQWMDIANEVAATLGLENRDELPDWVTDEPLEMARWLETHADYVDIEEDSWVFMKRDVEALAEDVRFAIEVGVTSYDELERHEAQR